MFPVDAFRSTIDKAVKILRRFGIRFQLFRVASEVDRRRIEELAKQLGLAPLLDEVLGESDEIS